MRAALRRQELAFEAILAESEIVNDAGLPETCGELAGVKFKLDKLDEARALYERALREAKRLAGDAETPRVGVCRYFLGEFLVRTGNASDALASIEPGLRRRDDVDRILFTTYAKCLWGLNRRNEARAAARRALFLAQDTDQRRRAEESMSEILADDAEAG